MTARTTTALGNAAALAGLNRASHYDFDWLAILARELRSPLGAIRSAVEVLEYAGELRIDLILEHVGCNIELRVEDDGIGIRAEALSQVLGSPEQSPNSFEGQQGYGIGFMLTKHIVELHGGTIHAYSDGLRKGSSFIVRLPVGSPYPPITTPERL